MDFINKTNNNKKNGGLFPLFHNYVSSWAMPVHPRFIYFNPSPSTNFIAFGSNFDFLACSPYVPMADHRLTLKFKAIIRTPLLTNVHLPYKTGCTLFCYLSQFSYIVKLSHGRWNWILRIKWGLGTTLVHSLRHPEYYVD